ncbi:MbnP family protein, partial [Tenacibaculum halocynthiae]
QGVNNLNFTFGFSDADNIDGVYQDLNTVSFNVPGMLGGGYHYMQFDGKYKDTNNLDANFNYHAIRAVNRSDPNNLIFEDTSFL